MSYIDDFLRKHQIEEVECLVPDLAGIATDRGHP